MWSMWYLALADFISITKIHFKKDIIISKKNKKKGLILEEIEK